VVRNRFQRLQEGVLPGLCDAQSVLAIPLVAGDRLIGVIAAEDADPMRFGEWHEADLEIVANQIAAGDGPHDRAVQRGGRRRARAGNAAARGPGAQARELRLTYYAKDEAVFVGDEYLIRSIPARILWKLLTESQRSGRTELTNRELRVDPSLRLPEVKDNLESRLMLLLRRRLQEKCLSLALVSTGRGRFALRASARLDLQER
jgi:GAF domain-containing protein